MKTYPEPLDLKKIKVYPLAERRSLSSLEKILVDPNGRAAACNENVLKNTTACAQEIASARKRGASVILIYGAHLIRNGAGRIITELLQHDWITHLATNGAGTIHDWEFAFLGRSTECVKSNVATGTFGTWDETGRCIHLALLAGALENEGYGRSLGSFIQQDGVNLPSAETLVEFLRNEPLHPLTPARAELLQMMSAHKISSGRIDVKHPWKEASVLAQAFVQNVPLTVHPGIGYDIISNHPMFNGAAIGRAAEIDYRLFGSAVERLDGGVVLSIGSAIMGPQVFEKSLSAVNNLRAQKGQRALADHTIHVVDLQDGGNWDWSKGEPPKDNPAYYLRFCKSFSRMGGAMHYSQCDNVSFLHNLLQQLQLSS